VGLAVIPVSMYYLLGSMTVRRATSFCYTEVLTSLSRRTSTSGRRSARASRSAGCRKQSSHPAQYTVHAISLDALAELDRDLAARTDDGAEQGVRGRALRVVRDGRVEVAELVVPELAHDGLEERDARVLLRQVRELLQLAIAARQLLVGTEGESRTRRSARR
jgi:hypothetical protein